MSTPKPHIPVGGRLRYFLSAWKEITSDITVLQMVRGMHLDLLAPPSQVSFPPEIIFKQDEVAAATEHIQQLIDKKAITECSFTDGFVSNIFLTPKHDGGFRMILNLKKFNKFVDYSHFKMESFQQILDSVVQDCFMSVLDLTDAYLTVPVSRRFVKYLQFAFRGKIYCYLCMPFGLSSAPRKFTKLLKPVVSFLRERGIILVIYIDDIWITAAEYFECYSSMMESAKLLTKLGFLLNRKKSKPLPSQCVTVLGYVVNSRSMTVSLPASKEEDILRRCKTILSSDSISIRCLASFIGKIVASFPAFKLARAHYRYLEWDKIKFLRANGFDYDAQCVLSSESIADVRWIVKHVVNTSAPIKPSKVSIELFVDASKYGWGATFGHHTTGGLFAEHELVHSINTKETFSILLALQSFVNFLRYNTVLIRSDNTTAVSTIAKMGTMNSYVRNSLATDIWTFVTNNNIDLMVSHVPGVDNPADQPSRQLSKFTEWSLPEDCFKRVVSLLGRPTIDLFASRLNNKLSKYVSWKPDPHSYKVDAFSLQWDEFAYVFPPFVLLSKVLSKIVQDRATAIVIFPYWTSQVWFPRLLKLLSSPIYLFSREVKLFLPWDPSIVHPLQNSLQLATAKLSGDIMQTRAFHRQFPSFSCHHKETIPRSHIMLPSTIG